MLRYILFSLFIASLAFAEKSKLSCPDLEKYAITDIDYNKVTGSWVSIKQLEFNDGYPIKEANESSVKSLCFHLNVKGKENGFDVSEDVHQSGNPDVGNHKHEFTQIEDKPKGYMKITSNAPQLNNNEAILLEFLDEKHMIMITCENYVRWLYFFSRLENKTAVPTTDENKQLVKEKYGDVFYITGTDIRASYYGNYCWEKY